MNRSSAQNDNMLTETKPQRFIQMQLPLTWLLAAAGAVVFSAGVASLQLKNLTDAVAKFDTSLQVTNANTAASITTNTIQQSQIDRAATAVDRLQQDVLQLQRNTRVLAK